MKSSDGKIIIAIAVALVGILIGATVLIMIRRDAEIPTEPVTEPSVTDISEESTQKQTEPESEPMSEAENPTEEETPPQVTEVTDAPQNVSYNEKILGDWEPESAYNSDTGEDIDLDILYGSGYKTYGGLLQFREDGTFSINIGVTEDGPSNNGIYTCTEETIAVTYNNDRSAEFTPTFAPDGTVATLLVPQHDYMIVFVKQ